MFQADSAEKVLRKLPFPKLTKARDTLNAPIILLDITCTIQNLSNGKAPGPDGYTSEFYKAFKDSLFIH